MNLSRHLMRATGVSAAAVLLSAVLVSFPAHATNPGTVSGVQSEGCIVSWKADAVLDRNLTNEDAEYPNLMKKLNGENTDYSNGGYISEVTPALGGPGIFEANHFFIPGAPANQRQVWRYPLATDHTLKAGTTITIDLPDDMGQTQFNRRSYEKQNQTIDQSLKGWGEPYSNYNWEWLSEQHMSAQQTDAQRNIWTLTLKKDLAKGTATIFQFEGTGDLNGRYVATAHLQGAYAEGEGTCTFDPEKLPPLPEPPALGTCQAALVGRTVWSPYGNDITLRQKFGKDWNSSAEGWGEVNADGWGLGADGWKVDGKTATMRFYGAVDKDFQGGTYTATIHQNATFVQDSINDVKTPGAGQLQGNGYTNAVTDMATPKISEDGKSLTFTIGALPAKSSFSFNVSVRLDREKYDPQNSKQLLPMVFTEQMVMSNTTCDAVTTTTEWSDEQPSCESPSVSQSRTMTTTAFTWSTESLKWMAEEPEVTTETREVLLPEGTDCSTPEDPDPTPGTPDPTPGTPDPTPSTPDQSQTPSKKTHSGKRPLARTGVSLEGSVLAASLLAGAGGLVLLRRRKH
ncbi:hypothetical protein [Schaalia sp. ZJ1691]|uniref:hypothetical protein n=1 Tax=Schaalia sp. ZJ1691 TaxID=2709404 RepID=UPI0013ED69CE|nr:hypothetical protein [Schaalia sp. ZJ1691]